jgi:hypothetical protein
MSVGIDHGLERNRKNDGRPNLPTSPGCDGGAEQSPRRSGAKRNVALRVEFRSSDQRREDLKTLKRYVAWPADFDFNRFDTIKHLKSAVAYFEDRIRQRHPTSMYDKDVCKRIMRALDVELGELSSLDHLSFVIDAMEDVMDSGAWLSIAESRRRKLTSALVDFEFALYPVSL